MAASTPKVAQRYLTKPEEALLIAFVGAKGENYSRYLDFCDRNEIPDSRRFTEQYFHVWCTRHRSALSLAKAHQADVVRSESTLDRENRIALLEEAVVRFREDIRVLTELKDRIEEEVVEEGFTHRIRRIPSCIETRLKVEEQLGKTLDRIAKERGEYAKGEDRKPPVSAGHAEMVRQAMAGMGATIALPQGRRADDIEAEFVYVDPTVAE